MITKGYERIARVVSFVKKTKKTHFASGAGLRHVGKSTNMPKGISIIRVSVVQGVLTSFLLACAASLSKKTGCAPP